MKKMIVPYFSLAFCICATMLGAQPKLNEINFLGLAAVEPDGQANLEEIVTVELKFNTSMDTTTNPAVRMGLQQPFTLNVPAVGQGWTSTQVWQGFFVVSNNVPETADG
ncbi:hypothetical protein IH785_07265, partial [candidate division KSB1 bacterium]|nr:hypothetical protein [candidate division KSB1 bacterium]